MSSIFISIFSILKVSEAVKSHIRNRKGESTMKSLIDNPALYEEGEVRVSWYKEHMPIVNSLIEEFRHDKPFKGLVMASCFHIEPKTAVWLEGMIEGGVEHIYLVGNLGTVNPDTAAYLEHNDHFTVLGRVKDTYEDMERYIEQIFNHTKIDFFLDNGASLILKHQEMNLDWKPIGANEETRTGRLQVERKGVAPDYPVIVIDDSPVKRLLENEIGVGSSVVDGFMRATSLLIAGKKVLVMGYGFCGSGVARKFKAMGAHTMVYDPNPVLRLKAKVDGHSVGALDEMLKQAHAVVTVTGQFNVLTAEHVPLLRDGVLLANAGHYGFEIDCEDMRKVADKVTEARPGIEALHFDTKKIHIIENAVPLNLSAADGNAIEVMDIGFGLQAAAARKQIIDNTLLIKGMQAVPEDIDILVSEKALTALE